MGLFLFFDGSENTIIFDFMLMIERITDQSVSVRQNVNVICFTILISFNSKKSDIKLGLSSSWLSRNFVTHALIRRDLLIYTCSVVTLG